MFLDFALLDFYFAIFSTGDLCQLFRIWLTLSIGGNEDRLLNTHYVYCYAPKYQDKFLVWNKEDTDSVDTVATFANCRPALSTILQVQVNKGQLFCFSTSKLSLVKPYLTTG